MTKFKGHINQIYWTTRSILLGRALWSCALMIMLCFIMLQITEQIKVVYVRDNGVTRMTHTFKQELDDILDEMGYTTRKEDVVDFSGFKGDMGLINITRSFPVQLTADGKTTDMLVTEKTVGELLEEQGIELGEFDQINRPLGRFLEEDDEIVIKRVDVNTIVEYETIPYETEYKENSLLRNGRTRMLTPGADGERAITYIERTVDGVVRRRQQTSSVVTKAPVTELVLRGSDDPVSKLDFGIPLDANGVPVTYKKLLTNQICTGYSSWKGAKGASRMVLSAGYVAVRADEIPYGTKMYITSPDNSFIYGFAIAADTGIGLMQNIIDFDLFYDTYRESALNGRKYLNVYIL